MGQTLPPVLGCARHREPAALAERIVGLAEPPRSLDALRIQPAALLVGIAVQGGHDLFADPGAFLQHHVDQVPVHLLESGKIREHAFGIVQFMEHEPELSQRCLVVSHELTFSPVSGRSRILGRRKGMRLGGGRGRKNGYANPFAASRIARPCRAVGQRGLDFLDTRSLECLCPFHTMTPHITAKATTAITNNKSTKLIAVPPTPDLTKNNPIDSEQHHPQVDEQQTRAYPQPPALAVPRQIAKTTRTILLGKPARQRDSGDGQQSQNEPPSCNSFFDCINSRHD